ncbi:hypothetical protein KKH27_07920 [bacterium]|nr:hypothetical protein [bacterium]MBU1984767.1 hypothetical protein [bacterium]
MWIMILSLMLVAMQAAAAPRIEWHHTYRGNGESDCRAVLQADDGGFFVVGTTGRARPDFYRMLADVWLIRTNAQGDSLWSRTYGSAELDECSFVLPMKDRTFVLGGRTQNAIVDGSQITDGWLLRVGANGDSLWSGRIGGEDSEDLICVSHTPDGGYIFGGNLSWYGSEYMDRGWDTDVWLVKTDSAFQVEWTRKYGGDYADYCRGVLPTENGYLAACWSQSFGGSGTWLLRMDARGDSIESRFFDGNVYSLLPTIDGGFVLAGSGGGDFWLHKISAAGDSRWSHTFGGAEYDFCGKAVALTDGGYLLLGSTHSFASQYSAGWLIRTDANGDSLWSVVGDFGSLSSFAAVELTRDGGFIVAGTTKLEGDSCSALLLVKLSAE